MEKEHSQIILNKILAAAQKRFGHYGLSKTTMNDIADDIGMSKASLYYYFKDKENIYKAVVEKEQNYFVQEMKKIIQSPNKAEWMLIEYVRLRLELLKELLSLGKFTQGSYQDFRPLIQSLLADFRKKEMSMVSEILKLGVTKKEFAIENIKKHSEFFLDTLRAIRLLILADVGMTEISKEKYLKINQQTKMFTELFIKGIKINNNGGEKEKQK
jgi:TetR/AcrR family transcriptional regulator